MDNYKKPQAVHMPPPQPSENRNVRLHKFTRRQSKPRSTCLSLNPTAFINDCALATLYPAGLIFPEDKTTDLDFCNIATDTKQTAKEINVPALC